MFPNRPGFHFCGEFCIDVEMREKILYHSNNMTILHWCFGKMRRRQSVDAPVAFYTRARGRHNRHRGQLSWHQVFYHHHSLSRSVERQLSHWRWYKSGAVDEVISNDVGAPGTRRCTMTEMVDSLTTLAPMCRSAGRYPRRRELARKVLLSKRGVHIRLNI